LKLYVDTVLQETKVVTTELAGQLAAVASFIAKSGLTAAAHNLKITCDFANGSGTFGSSSYEYSTNTANSSPNQTASANANGGTSVLDTETINFPVPVTTGWEVYQVDYTMVYDYVLNQLGGLGPGISCSSVGSTFFGISHGISGSTTTQSVSNASKTVTISSLSSSFTISARSGNASYSASQGLLTWITCKTLTVKAYLRRYPSADTTPNNELRVVEYTYDVAAGTVISTGAVKWGATGE
jgi:hypothetical protein